MLKNLEGDDEESTAEYLKSLFFSLDYHKLLPLAITMFQKYREVCPDRIELRTMAAACNGFKKVYTDMHMFFCMQWSNYPCI